VSAATIGLIPICRITLRQLAERMDVALDRLDVRKRRSFDGQQLMPHRHEVLAHDVQARMRHEMMDVGDAAGDRVLDRDHADIGVTGRDGRKAVLERWHKAWPPRPDRLRGSPSASLAPARLGTRTFLGLIM